MSSRKWLRSLFLFCVLIFVVLGATVYLYDPFCYYRLPRDRFIVNNYRFLNAGIIKNVDYDAVVIGSSMAQNFRMELFREHMGMNPAKLTLGALSVKGFELLYEKVKHVGKARSVVFCIDLPSLNQEEEDQKIYPTYLYDENPWNDYKYLYGYETWMRLLPLSVLFGLVNEAGVPLRRFYGTKNIDEIGAWDGDFPYSKEIVMRDYLSGAGSLSEQRTDGVYERMIANADKLFKIMEYDENDGKQYYFFFPPYSVLYWYDARQKGYVDVYQEVKREIVARFDSKKNVKIFDFQAMDEIADLDNYRDITHYSGRINDLMVEYMATGRMLVDSISVDRTIEKLEVMVERFAASDNGIAIRANRPNAK